MKIVLDTNVISEQYRDYPDETVIAAIWIAHGAALAPRNTDDFDELGMTLIDPWKC